MGVGCSEWPPGAVWLESNTPPGCPVHPPFPAAAGVATLGCALYTVPLSPGMVYPARFLWGLAAGTWPVVLATVRRCSASMGELSRATMLASQAQTLG